MKTSLELRQSRSTGVPENTLRALPGQFLEDGTPIDTSLNIQAPKDNAFYGGGTRLEYPVGTVFGCDHLELLKTRSASYYSVYDSSKGETSQNPGTLRFHPVSDDPSFVFASTAHRDIQMNNAYIAFAMGRHAAPTPAATRKVSASVTSHPRVCLAFVRPQDSNGNARAAAEGWTEVYPGQIQAEGEIIRNWFKTRLKSMGIRPAVTPSLGPSVIRILTTLYSAGETVDSLVSAARLNAVMTAEKVDAVGLSILTRGPFAWYLETIEREHSTGAPCTAVSRDANDAASAAEAAYAVCMAHNARTGNISMPETPSALESMRKALEAGWSVNEMLLPENLERNDDYEDYLEAMADGTVPVPERPEDTGLSFIEGVMSNRKNECPKDGDGFHVDPAEWKKLVRNLYRKTNTLLVGPTGTGKTQLIQKLCEQTGTPYTVIQMGTITDPTEQLVGKMDIVSTGGTVFDYADFALAIQNPGVVILDEINRCPRNGTNILFSCLDNTRCITASGAKSSDMRVIPVHPDCVFFATANIGYEYSGTAQIDKALMTRFMTVKTKYLTVDQEREILKVRTGIGEKDAYNIAFIANQIRRKNWENELSSSVSTRETLLCAEYVHDGFSCEEAIEACFYPLFDEGNAMWGSVDVNSELHKVKVIVDGLLTKETS